MTWFELKRGDVLLPKAGTRCTFIVLETDETHIRWYNVEMGVHGRTEIACRDDLLTHFYDVLRGREVHT